jgi:hypothetical protein
MSNKHILVGTGILSAVYVLCNIVLAISFHFN